MIAMFYCLLSIPVFFQKTGGYFHLYSRWFLWVIVSSLRPICTTDKSAESALRNSMLHASTVLIAGSNEFSNRKAHSKFARALIVSIGPVDLVEPRTDEDSAPWEHYVRQGIDHGRAIHRRHRYSRNRILDIRFMNRIFQTFSIRFKIEYSSIRTAIVLTKHDK